MPPVRRPSLSTKVRALLPSSPTGTGGTTFRGVCGKPHIATSDASWRLMPPRPAVDRFVSAVMTSWRSAAGGEPDVGLTLPALLQACGFQIRQVRPLVFAVRPADRLRLAMARY